MQAWNRDRYGSADVLELRTVDRPTLGANDVLVDVEAAGIDRGVWHLVTGLPYLVRLAGYGMTRPKDPGVGMDVAGTVVAIGPDVTRFRPGDEVFGIARGSFAEEAAAHEDKLAPKPPSASFQQAAVAAVSGTTALQALTDVGGLEAGQSVLVLGASGGVGSYAVQLARVLGGHVTGVCSARKVDMVRGLGADRVIDYTSEDFVDSALRYDLIVDLGGRNSIGRLRTALARRGTLVIAGGEAGGRWTGGVGRQMRAMVLSPFVSQRLTTFISKEHFASMERLADFLERGDVTPAIGRVYDFHAVPEALRDLEEGRISGKAAIAVH